MFAVLSGYLSTVLYFTRISSIFFVRVSIMTCHRRYITVSSLLTNTPQTSIRLELSNQRAKWGWVIPDAVVDPPR